MHGYETVMRDVGGESCRCGKAKKAGRPFCSACYFALPEWYQRRAFRIAGGMTRKAARLVYWHALILLGIERGKGNEHADAA
jgi:hypothetical protein